VRVTFFTKFPKVSRNWIVGVNPLPRGASVGEFRKTRHPCNVKFDKVLETCFQGQETHDFREPGTCDAPNSQMYEDSGILIQ
jgi:hypothetical protein